MQIKSMSGYCVATPRKFSMPANLDVSHYLTFACNQATGWRTAELFLNVVRDHGAIPPDAIKARVKGQRDGYSVVQSSKTKKMLPCIQER